MSDVSRIRVFALSLGLLGTSLLAAYVGVGTTLAHADAAARTGLPEPSLKQLEELYSTVRRAPWSATDFTRLGMFYLANNRPAPAIEWFRRATLVNAAAFEPLYYMGLAQRAAHRYSDAAVSFRKVLQLNPEYVAARVQLANLLLDEGHFADAASSFDDLTHSTADKVRVAQGLGMALLRIPNFKSADQAFTNALSRFFSYGDAHTGLAIALKAQGENERAAREARLAFNDRAMVPLRTDDPLTEAMEQEFPTGLSLFQAAARNRDPRSSVAIMERALSLDPSMTFGWEYLISLYGTAKRPQDAEKAWERLQRLEPSSTRGRYELAVALAQSQQLPKARELLNQALALDPAFSEAHRMLGVVAQFGGDKDEAARQFRAAIEGDPGLAEAHVDLGLLLLKAGDAKQGQLELLRALAPPCEQPERTLSRELAALRDNPAEPAFEQAVKVQAEAENRLSLITLLNNRRKPPAGVAPPPGTTPETPLAIR